MSNGYKLTIFCRSLLIIFVFTVFLRGIFSSFESQIMTVGGLFKLPSDSFVLDSVSLPELIILQENSLASISNPTGSLIGTIGTTRKIKMVITAYSSTPWETDENPHITASGKRVRDGIVANNMLPFGTKITIPEIYGDKVFVVEDRMSWKKSNYHIDLWMPSYWEARNFGAKRTYIEILEG